MSNMAIAERERIKRVETLLCKWFDGVSFVEIYRSNAADVFAEIFDADEIDLAEFNVTELAQAIVRELDER